MGACFFGCLEIECDLGNRIVVDKGVHSSASSGMSVEYFLTLIIEDISFLGVSKH